MHFNSTLSSQSSVTRPRPIDTQASRFRRRSTSRPYSHSVCQLDESCHAGTYQCSAGCLLIQQWLSSSGVRFLLSYAAARKLRHMLAPSMTKRLPIKSLDLLREGRRYPPCQDRSCSGCFSSLCEEASEAAANGKLVATQPHRWPSCS